MLMSLYFYKFIISIFNFYLYNCLLLLVINFKFYNGIFILNSDSVQIYSKDCHFNSSQNTQILHFDREWKYWMQHFDSKTA